MSTAIEWTELIQGDVLDVLRGMKNGSVDAVVTDPPYGLEFMGKEWDRLDVRQPGDPTFHKSGAGPFDRSKVRHASSPAYGGVVGSEMQRWHHAWAVEALRVLKPGGHLLAFGGTRTHHRLMCALEDAGFEIRDTLMWLYGSGFPKSLDVSKAIDKAAGAKREVIGHKRAGIGRHGRSDFDVFHGSADESDKRVALSAPATDAAHQWEGWGTALKPAWEPIVLARKPLSGTVAANVQEHGTGALNVDGCRVGLDGAETHRTPSRSGLGKRGIYGASSREQGANSPTRYDPGGRWPANVALDEGAAAMLDAQSGERGGHPVGEPKAAYGGSWSGARMPFDYGDSGGASRFFYCAKASREEREAGVGDEEKPLHWSSGDQNPGSFQSDGTKRSARNNHPTVKPVDLMRWLVRLVTPPGGLILDPFIGSGTTAVAAILEGFRCIGIDNNAEYLATAQARIERAILERDSGGRAQADEVEAGQLTLEGAP